MKTLARSTLVMLLVMLFNVVSAQTWQPGKPVCVPSLLAYDVETFPEFDYEAECSKCFGPTVCCSEQDRVASINSCIDRESADRAIAEYLWDSSPIECRSAAIARVKDAFRIQRSPMRNLDGSYRTEPRAVFFYTFLEPSLQACVEKFRLYKKRPGVDY
jgi:hypothetical protein